MSKESESNWKWLTNWKALVIVGLMLAAMLAYVLSDDEQDPGGVIDQPTLESHSAPMPAADDAAE